jgi:folate-binding protein YgfZ
MRAWAILLSSKGKVLFDFDLAATDDGFLLSTSPGRSAALLQAVDTYLFAEKALLEDASERHAPLDLCGPGAVDVLREVTGVEPPTADHATVEGVAVGEPVRVTHLPVAGSPGWRVDAGPDAVRDLWEALVERGATPAGIVARDSLRVEACAALDGVDIDENVYPQEARLESAFSLDKGCYIGQEVVAKIDTYGGLNKRLVALRVDHGDPIARGTPLVRVEGDERRELGLVTSWAWSFALDTGLVLAYVKRRHQAVGTEFLIGDGPAVATIVRAPVREGALPVTGEFE